MAALLIPQSRPNPKAHGTLMKVKHGYSWDVTHVTGKLLFTTSYMLKHFTQAIYSGAV